MPEPQAEPKRVRVFGPDNKYYSFPEGTTKETAVSFFKKKGITSPEAPKPAAVSAPASATPPTPKPEAKAVTKPTVGQKMDIEAEREMGIISRFRPRWDTPEQVLKDPTWYGRSTKYLGGELVAAGKTGASFAVGGAKIIHDLASALDPIEGYQRPLGEPQLQFGKDVVDVGKGIIDVGKATWDLIRHFPEADADPEKLGSTVTNAAMIVDGGVKLAQGIVKNFPKANASDAVTTAHKASSDVPSRLLRRKAFEDAYVHSKGLDVAKKVDKAAKAVQSEVKTHAEGIASQIDTKIPTGVVDAAAEAATIIKEFRDVVKTPDKAHPALSQMVKDAAATAPKLWSWEKARQFRSSVGRSIGKVEGPQKAVLTRVYIDLTKKLGGAAKQYGLEKSWTQYNELASKMDKQFGDLVDDIRDSQSGQGVSQKLGKDKGLTIEFVNNLKKYGLNPKEILDFSRTALRILKRRDFWNTSIFRLIYGTPIAGAGLLLSRIAGASYPEAALSGLTVGVASSFLVDMARVLKLSPDIIEHMMKERELPGRMKFEPGTFPEGEEPTPEVTAPKTPPQLPEPSGPTGGETETEHAIRTRGMKTPSKIEPPPKAPDVRSYEKKPPPVEATKAEPGQHGTGKLAEQSKARERITKNRGLAKRTKEAQAAEATARAQATHMDVSQLQIPEMEEYLRAKNPTALSGLMKMRKRGTPDAEYIEGLKYLILEDLEK